MLYNAPIYFVSSLVLRILFSSSNVQMRQLNMLVEYQTFKNPLSLLQVDLSRISIGIVVLHAR